MNRRQKIIATSLWVLLLGCTVVLAAVWSAGRLNLIPRSAHATEDGPILFDVPDFQLTDQQNRDVSLQSLKGHPWIAAFIFTRCPGPCPVMTREMAEMQASLPAEGRLVSFTLDAEYDTPDVLQRYAEQYKADAARWHFLTGEQDVITRIADAMKIYARRGPTPIDIEHGTHFVLVNPDGKVHNYYRHDDPDARAQLLKDAAALAAQ
jgi:protein SCO1